MAVLHYGGWAWNFGGQQAISAVVFIQKAMYKWHAPSPFLQHGHVDYGHSKVECPVNRKDGMLSRWSLSCSNISNAFPLLWYHLAKHLFVTIFFHLLDLSLITGEHVSLLMNKLAFWWNSKRGHLEETVNMLLNASCNTCDFEQALSSPYSMVSLSEEKKKRDLDFASSFSSEFLLLYNSIHQWTDNI